MHCNAPARKRDRNLWQRNVSQACYVALCRAVRAFAGKFSKFAANVQKSAQAETAALLAVTGVECHSATYHGGRCREMLHESVVEASAHCGEQKAFTCFGVGFLHMTQRSEAAQRIHLSSVACGIGALP